MSTILWEPIYTIIAIGIEFINFEICNICGNEEPEICESIEIYYNDLNFLM